MAETDGIVREFLLESFENLEQTDTDLVALETQPGDRVLLDRVFRVVHTIKGTCGFLGFARLEALTHEGEGVLSRLRDGELRFTPEVAGTVLGLVDAIRQILAAIEGTGEEGDADFVELKQTLARLKAQASAEAAPPDKPVRRRGKRRAVSGEAEASPPVAATRSEPVPVAPPPSPPGAAPDIEPEPPAEDELEPQASGAATGAAGVAEGASVSTVVESNVRVDVRVLDQLMDLVGELVLTRNELLRLGGSELGSASTSALQHLNLVTSELQEGIMKTRMQPVGKIWGKFPRMVRDLATACGKQVRLEMEGQETELDRSLIEAIRDPLTHLVRNAIDHGVENPEERVAAGKPATGRLWLKAFPEGGQVNIQISDDGAGINPEKVRKRVVAQGLMRSEQAARLTSQEALNLIFLPGFSTAENVTSMSGRGVGMDVVKTNIERVNGLVDVESEVGGGTTVNIKIPLTLAIIPALIVSSAGERFAIPQSSVLELVRLMGDQLSEAIERIHGAPVYRLRGRLLPIVDLTSELEMPAHGRESATIVVLQADDRQFGLLVDAVIDSQEIVVKPLGGLLERVPVFVGATIMGDARVALILDVLGLAQRAHVVSEEHDRRSSEDLTPAAEAAEEAEQLLLCRSPDDGRMAIPLAQVARLETLPASSVERVGSETVVQYRGDILPLIDISEQLPERRGRPRSGDGDGAAENLNVVVYSVGGEQVGLVVGGIVDIVEEVVTVRRPGSRDGVKECAVIRGKVTEFLDVEGIIRRAVPRFFDRGTGSER